MSGAGRPPARRPEHLDGRHFPAEHGLHVLRELPHQLQAVHLLDLQTGLHVLVFLFRGCGETHACRLVPGRPPPAAGGLCPPHWCIHTGARTTLRPRKTSPNNRQETPLIRCPLIHILQREAEAQRGRELDRGHTASAGAALQGCEARGVCAPHVLQGWVLPDSRPVGLGALRGLLSRHLGPREALPRHVS